MKKELRLAPDELISIKGCCDEVFRGLGFGGGFFHADYFAKTTQVDVHAMQVGQRYNVLNRTANWHIRFRREQNAAGTNVARLRVLRHKSCPGSHDAKRQMKVETRSSALFHHGASCNLVDSIGSGQAFETESVMVLRSESPHIGGKKIGVTTRFSREEGQLRISKFSLRRNQIYNGTNR